MAHDIADCMIKWVIADERHVFNLHTKTRSTDSKFHYDGKYDVPLLFNANGGMYTVHVSIGPFVDAYVPIRISRAAFSPNNACDKWTTCINIDDATWVSFVGTPVRRVCSMAMGEIHEFYFRITRITYGLRTACSAYTS